MILARHSCPMSPRTQTPASSCCRCVCRALRSWSSSQLVQPSTSGFTIGKFPPCATELGSSSTRPSCRFHGFANTPNSVSRFPRSSLFRLRILRRDTTAALMLTMCSVVLVGVETIRNNCSTNSQRVSAVLCSLKRICSPSAAFCSLCLALDALVSCHTVAADVERRQRPCCMSHKPFQD